MGTEREDGAPFAVAVLTMSKNDAGLTDVLYCLRRSGRRVRVFMRYRYVDRKSVHALELVSESDDDAHIERMRDIAAKLVGFYAEQDPRTTGTLWMSKVDGGDDALVEILATCPNVSVSMVRAAQA